MNSVNRIPSQRNDATKTMSALITNTNGGQTIVTAFLWQDDWYDVRMCSEAWYVDKLDMDRTKLFETRAEARAAAGIAHIPDPKGKKKVTLSVEAFHFPRMIADPNQKRLTYPDDAVIEIGGDDNFGTESFRVTYYEDEKSKDAVEAIAKVETAAKSLQNAATEIRSHGQPSIVPPRYATSASRRIPAGLTISSKVSEFLDRVHVVTPDELREEVARKKEANKKAQIAKDRKVLEEFKTAIRTKIHRRLTEELSERFSMQAEIVFAEPAWHVVDSDGSPLPVTGVGRQFPWNAESNSAFMEVIEEFKKAGWECSTTIGYNSSQRTEIGYNRITLKITPSST